MAKLKETAGEIQATKQGEIVCRLCKGNIDNDPPETVLIGYDGLGQHGIDEHEACDGIEVALKKSKAQFEAYLASAGVKAEDRGRARDVLRVLLERGALRWRD